MFVSDLFRTDSLILLLLAESTKPASARDLIDALDELDLAFAVQNMHRELTFMQERGLVTFVGYKLIYGRHRTKLYEVTDAGRITAGRRRGLFLKILHEPPQVVGYDLPSSTSDGWT